MKRKYILVFAALASVLAVSCNKQETEILEQNEIIINASIGDEIGLDTRTYLSDKGVFWKSGDSIQINGNTASLVSGGGSRNAIFLGAVSPYDGNKYLAGYPASACTYSAGTLTVGIPARQTYNAVDTLLAQIPMAAYAECDSPASLSLSFKNAANLLQLNLTGSAGNASKVDSIVITSSTAPLSGKIAVNPVAGTGNVTFGTMTETGKTITLDCGAGVQLTSTPQPFYVIVPSISVATVLTVKIFCANGLYQQNTINVDGTTVDLSANSNKIFRTSAKNVTATKVPGVLSGLFSVSATKQVQFSQGNLYCVLSASDTTFHFEDNQIDYRTFENQYSFLNQARSSTGTPAKHRGLFGFSTNNANNQWGLFPNTDPSSKWEGAFVDWGENPIVNGGNTPGIWRTLSETEAKYMVETRTFEGHSRDPYTYACAYIQMPSGSEKIWGIMLYPDGFNPSLVGITVSSGGNVSWANWQILEANGVLFLPSAGDAQDGTVKSVHQNNTVGYYWTSTGSGSGSSSSAVRFSFEGTNTLGWSDASRYYHRAVRLAKDYTGSTADSYAITTW